MVKKGLITGVLLFSLGIVGCSNKSITDANGNQVGDEGFDIYTLDTEQAIEVLSQLSDEEQIVQITIDSIGVMHEDISSLVNSYEDGNIKDFQSTSKKLNENCKELLKVIEKKKDILSKVLNTDMLEEYNRYLTRGLNVIIGITEKTSKVKDLDNHELDTEKLDLALEHFRKCTDIASSGLDYSDEYISNHPELENSSTYGDGVRDYGGREKLSENIVTGIEDINKVLKIQMDMLINYMESSDLDKIYEVCELLNKKAIEDKKSIEIEKEVNNQKEKWNTRESALVDMMKETLDKVENFAPTLMTGIKNNDNDMIISTNEKISQILSSIDFMKLTIDDMKSES